MEKEIFIEVVLFANQKMKRGKKIIAKKIDADLFYSIDYSYYEEDDLFDIFEEGIIRNFISCDITMNKILKDDLPYYQLCLSNMSSQIILLFSNYSGCKKIFDWINTPNKPNFIMN